MSYISRVTVLGIACWVTILGITCWFWWKPTSASPTDKTPKILPVTWKRDVSNIPVPNRPATGSLRKKKFVVEKATISTLTQADKQGKYTQYYLTLSQGGSSTSFPDLEVDVFTTVKFREKLDGKVFKVRPPDSASSKYDEVSKSSLPSVEGAHLSWLPPGEELPETKMYFSDEEITLRLEFGRAQKGKIPGKIYLCFPDWQKSFVAGKFIAVFDN